MLPVLVNAPDQFGGIVARAAVPRREEIDESPRLGGRIAARIDRIDRRLVRPVFRHDAKQPAGFDVADLLRVQNPDVFARMRGEAYPTYNAWLNAAQPGVVFEATSLNVETGQPAIDHIRAALEHGAHAITANKGPVVHAYVSTVSVAI